jgi:hypothetical protein
LATRPNLQTGECRRSQITCLLILCVAGDRTGFTTAVWRSLSECSRRYFHFSDSHGLNLFLGVNSLPKDSS